MPTHRGRRQAGAGNERQPLSAAGARIALSILLAGIAGATGDIVFAFVYYPVSPERVLQSVAAGLLGRDVAFGGGIGTAAIGAACHYLISIGAAAVFVLASRAWPMLVRQPWLWGPIFGIGMYVVMNAVVVPLSAAGRPLDWAFLTQWKPLLAHMFLFGLPAALVARWLADHRDR
jgi:hypothetical protein